MNDDVEQLLRRVGGDDVWDSRPQPDPLGRLAARVQRRRTGRRLATGAALAGVVAVAAVGATLAFGNGSSTHRDHLASRPAAVAACSVADLRLKQLPDVSFSARWAQATYRLTNTGTTSCTLRGYPTVSAKTASARSIALRVHETTRWASGNVRVTEVTLQPGASADFNYAVMSADCAKHTTATVYLRPPGASTSTRGFARPHATFCSGQSVFVSPVTSTLPTTSH